MSAASPFNSFTGALQTSSNAAAGNAGITFKLGASPNDPNAIVFGDESNPLVGSLLELPGEVESLGGVQNHAVHLFPGGYKTVQALGAFPHAIGWGGILLGGTASARSFQIDTWRRNGQTAYLSLGPWIWKGIVTSYRAPFMHQNYIRYEMTFEPTQDLTASPPADAFTGTSMNSLLQQINAASGVSDASLNALIAFSSVATGLLGVAGVLTAAQAQALTQAEADAVTALDIDANSADIATQIAAGNYTGLVNAVTAGLSTQQTQTSLTLINPNLATLASQYLGDASRWSEIADLNGLNDMEPAGLFTLAIPAL